LFKFNPTAYSFKDYFSGTGYFFLQHFKHYLLAPSVEQNPMNASLVKQVSIAVKLNHLN